MKVHIKGIISVSPDSCIFPDIERAFLVAQLVKNLLAVQETLFQFLGQEDPWRRDRIPTPVLLGFPGGSDGKESTCNTGDPGLIPGLGRSPGGGILSRLYIVTLLI